MVERTASPRSPLQTQKPTLDATLLIDGRGAPRSGSPGFSFGQDVVVGGTGGLSASVLGPSRCPSEDTGGQAASATQCLTSTIPDPQTYVRSASVPIPTKVSGPDRGRGNAPAPGAVRAFWERAVRRGLSVGERESGRLPGRRRSAGWVAGGLPVPLPVDRQSVRTGPRRSFRPSA